MRSGPCAPRREAAELWASGRLCPLHGGLPSADRGRVLLVWSEWAIEGARNTPRLL